MVLGKLKKASMPITEGMEIEELEQILDVLFPGKESVNGKGREPQLGISSPQKGPKIMR